MAYEVTATRRRPQRFEDLVGQEFVVATLKNAIQSGKIAHAYLFSGPRGCGKTSSARILAKVLNCESGPEKAPCGHCNACIEIAKGSSMDVIEIDGASNTSVNDVRQIKDEVLFPPNTYKYKVYIIDEVHMLSTSAFNALLKTIEEPPPYVIFIFATTEIHKVPATIKSRCQQFNFRLGSVEKIKELLAKAAIDSGIKADDEALYWIAKESTGSFRDAYTLFDQVAAFSEGYITFDKIRDKLGLVGVERLNQICEVCLEGNTSGAIEQLDEVLLSGVSIEQFISNIADYMRNLLLLKSGISKEALLGQAPERFSSKVLQAWSSLQIERALSLFLQLFRDVRYSLNPRYEVELALSRLCWLSSYVSIADVRNTLEKAKAVVSNSPIAVPSVESGVASMAATPKPVQNQQRPGMATFSILSNTGAESNTVPRSDTWKRETDSNKQEQPGGNSHPFSNGGYQESESLSQVTAVSSTETKRSSVTLEDLRDLVIQEISSDKALLASALMQTKEWILTGNRIEASLESAFQMRQLENEAKYISEKITSIFGKNVQFVPILERVQVEQEQTEVPPVVEMVCKVFKGSVVSKSKSLHTTVAPTQQKQPQSTENENIDFSQEYVGEEESEY
jgi:DNA polymerase-3 subunit gamma/tau